MSESSNVEQPVGAVPPRSFDRVFRSVQDVQGWMTRAQAGRLWDRASELESGAQVVEIGSFHGRSIIVMASAAPEGVCLIAIDPHGGNDRGPQEIQGFETEAEADHLQFLANLEATGVRDRVTHLRMYSNVAHAEVDGAVDLLYIDGAHRFGPARQDIRSWGARVAPGGVMLIHDSFSSIGVTAALAVELFTSASFAYEGRSGSMTQYRRRPVGLRGRVANLAGQAASLPWFMRNLVIKGLIVARLGRLTRFLGGNGYWPY